MADSMLSDLPSASAINDTDLLYAVVEGVSKKITKQVLFNAVTQVLSTKADLVQGVLALAQMRENMKIVLNDTARFALTTSDVKNGFIIIVQQDEHGVPYSPNPKMYIVVDDTKLDEEDGYQAFASDVDWSTIENKPDNIVFSGPALATENVPAIDAYLHKSDVVDNFTDGGTEVPLSAECGKLLNSTLTLITDTLTPTLPDTDTTEYGTGCAYSKFGHIVIVYFSFKITNAQTGYSHRKSVGLNLPNGLNPTRVINEMASNGDADGMTSCSLSPNGTLTIYPQKTGTTYAVGQFTYLI